MRRVVSVSHSPFRGVIDHLRRIKTQYPDVILGTLTNDMNISHSLSDQWNLPNSLTINNNKSGRRRDPQDENKRNERNEKDWGEIFDFEIHSKYIGSRKPEKEMFDVLIEEQCNSSSGEIELNEVLFLDDLRVNTKQGQRMGLASENVGSRATDKSISNILQRSFPPPVSHQTIRSKL